MKENQIIREQNARPGAFRPVDLGAESVKTGDSFREGGDGPQRLANLDAKMVGAITTLFFAWRKIIGWLMFSAKAIGDIEARLYKQNQRISALEEQAEGGKCASCSEKLEKEA